MRLIVTAMLTLGLTACSAPAPRLDEMSMFVMQEGSTVSEAGLTLTFVRIVADSRCPADVQCIWEGNAEVEVLASSASGPAARLSLNTNRRFATQAIYLTYRVELMEVAPCAAGEKRSCIQLRVHQEPGR